MILQSTVFADTSYYLALLNQHDAQHARAASLNSAISSAGTRMVTTEAVLWETLNSLAIPVARKIAHRFYQLACRDPAIDIIGYDAALIDQAIELYGARPDKAWGITDCFSFVVMRMRGLTQALSADHHFSQAGYQALLCD